jgi:hypothetical protein
MAFKIERRASWMLMYVCVCEKAYQFRDMNDHACCTLCICTFLIIFFIIYWSILSSPSKLIISPYQNLWLKVFELCCITFLRMRSSIELPRKNSCQSVLRNWCATSIAPCFFFHLWSLKSSSLPNDIWVEWIVSLGWDIAWYDNLSHVL